MMNKKIVGILVLIISAISLLMPQLGATVSAESNSDYETAKYEKAKIREGYLHEKGRQKAYDEKYGWKKWMK